MMKGGSFGKKKGSSQSQDHDFAQLIFSWSLDDILNDNLYEHQVEKIPLTFQSEEHYFGSFVYPLLEETRTELASSVNMMDRAPRAEISSFRMAKGKEKMMYDVTVGNWRNSERRKESYRTLPGDLLILTNGEPGSVSDLQSVGSTWAFLLVNNTEDDDSGTPVQFKVTASQKIELHDGMFVVFLMNITTQKRIWNSLHKHANLDIIKEILYPDSVVNEKCDMCSLGFNSSIQKFDQSLVSKLNESQKAAIMASIGKMECCHKSSVGQIWGPPGTGKTMTVSVMLSIFLQMKCRTLMCAPTNVAIIAVASRVLSLVKELSKTITASGDSFCSIGDLLLFGNKERLKVGTNLEEIYLEHRVERLTECLGSLTGWKHCIKSMIDLLDDCVSQYHVFVENELFKEEQLTNENKSKTNNLKVKSFMEFVRERFSYFVQPLRRCIITFCTHIPRSFMKQENFQAMVTLLDNLSSLESLLSKKNLVSDELEHLFVSKPLKDDFVNSGNMSSINSVRIISLSLLKTLQTSLGGLKLPSGSRDAITRFCYERASLIFCTTSTSYKLQKFKIEPLKLLVIDEAAQMKESEAIIPLQIPGMRHAILIGDECQLPATVKSNVSSECGLGRSLFERLSLLGHSKHLLKFQYRMHPRISSFPNRKFYQKKILDAENVTCKSYGRKYLPGPMFGSYSFINIVGGREEGDDVGSKRNMVEVSIVIKIVQKLYKEWQQSKKKVSIGVVSPYTAQVVSIEEKLRYKYEKRDGFSVTVKSIDGFQGGEEDIIILSTVRSNSHGSVGFTSSHQRTNVALTRARHCLWILGNERTLARSDSIWKDLVFDARNRHCLFDADADKCLKKIIIHAKKELEPLNDMVKGNSLLLKHVKWKILFSDNFRKSFGKLMDSRMKNVVVDFLQKLSGGWRPNDGNTDLKVLKIYKVEGLHVVCTVDIIKEFKYIQVLRIWDLLPLKEVPNLRKELDSIFATYTNDYMNCCTTKHMEGNLEIPKSWVASQNIIQFRNVSRCEGDNEVSESLLHMKFYSLSPGMVDHLRFGREIDLPMQLSDEQMDAFLCSKSSFIIGRLGTGKTTILTMKLLQNEQSFRVASEGFCKTESRRVRDYKVVDDHEESKPTVLRQLFVTVSPKSCSVVKQHVSHLTSVSCDGNSSREINLDDADVTLESDVPDTFVDVPEKSYPLVITFNKFLMMLDGTLGDSFFERFHEAREDSHGNHISSRSVALQTFIRSRNVTFDRFCSLYWPHFDSSLKKKLDPSRVFSEIIYHIKGGLHAGEIPDGKLTYEGYSLLSEGCVSTLTKQKRETVNTLFQAYERMKTERREFDLGDLVNDLHRRLKNKSYEGDQMDFIYIDEVQDLSMRQISLFKYICQNVDEGFSFAGDIVLNIARGIDFRLEDIRSMLYTEFLGTRASGKQEKVDIFENFQLKQNSRTHAGVLKLAQSVIDILYCYFAHSVDILEPETTLCYGEAPVLLNSGNDKNAIVKILGGTRTSKGIVGFGAEQVILVRDNYAKTEICEYVGNHALVLTIEECKGLEFQDVLLYNFFGSSPLKDQWSVIYGYMKEQDLFAEELPHSFPSFKESRHNVLCSELKQLYVAITRTRQRLWICENKEELSKPMFDYWKGRCLVKVRKLNDSVARAMQCASSPQEWLERGKKLFYENVFVMATMCFERAGDSMWETMSKASGLRTSADQMRGTNPKAASSYLREAAEMFDSIGKLELAATCYSDLGDHERAGDLLRRRNGCNLNLNPDMVAEAFASIEDPLLIVSSENATPRVHAPCAIFVDLRRSRAEIMNVLLPGETTIDNQKDKATRSEALREENHVEETSDEHSNGDHSLVELEVENQSGNNNTQESGSKTGMGNSRRKKSKKNRGSNTQNTLATVLLDELPCAREGTTPPEAKNSWDDLTTLLERNNSWGDLTTLPEAKNSWDDLTTLQEGNKSCGDLKQPSYAPNMSRPEVELPVSTSGKRTGVQTTAERLQSSKRMVDAFSSQTVIGREWKVVKKVGSESSNMIEALPEEKCVEEADDQHTNVGQSLLESVLENKTSNDSTQNVEIKKGKGKNKGQWIKKNKGSNSLSTFTGDEHINDLSPVELMLEKQTSNENSKDVEFKEGKGKNMEKWIKKNKVSNSVNTFNGDDNSNDYPLTELMLEKQTSSENTQDAEIKNGKWKSKKNKGGSSPNTFTTVLVDEQHCVREATILQRANMACNDLNRSSSASNTSQPEADLLVSKSGETTVQTFVEKLQSRRPMVDGFFSYVGSENSNITEPLQVENHAEETDHDELSIGDHSSLELWLESQGSNDTTQDMENNKRKGKYIIGEDTTMCEENSACNDLERSSSAFDRRINTLDAVKCGSFLGLAVAFLGIRMWRKT